MKISLYSSLPTRLGKGEWNYSLSILPYIDISCTVGLRNIYLGWLFWEIKFSFEEKNKIMENNNNVISFPHEAVYLHKIMRWGVSGTKVFDYVSDKVMVIGESEKSYKIQFQSGPNEFNGRETFVRKNKINFNYLINKDYCLKKQRNIPSLACKICYEKCALRLTNMP